MFLWNPQMIPLNRSGERKLLVNWVALETLADTGMNCRVTWGMAPTWGKTPMASFSYVIAVLLKSELVKYVTSAAYWIYINVRVDFYLSSWWRIRLRFRLKHYKIVISNIRDCDSVARTFENLTLNRFKRCMRRWFYARILRISHTTDVYEYIT